MAETEVFYNSWTPFPDYALSSTGSLRLSGLPERCPSTTVLGFESAHRRSSKRKRREDEEEEEGGTSTRATLTRGIRKAWSTLSWRRELKKQLPIVKTLRHYKVSRDLLSDVVAGVTVGVMMIPQAMAFAFVATLPPIVGLYMAFFSSLVYILLGTAQHLSWNCVAVLAIMMGNLLDAYDARLRHTLPQDLALLSSNLTPPSSSLLPSLAASASSPPPNVSDGNLLLHHLLSSSSSSSPSSPLPGPFSAQQSSVHLLSGFFWGRGQVVADAAGQEVTSAVPNAHVSEGSSNDSVTSTITAAVTSSSSFTAGSDLESVISRKKVELACSVTFLSGVILAVLGKLGLGRLASFMSDSLVISFMVGVAFHVMVGQVGSALGLTLPTHSGAFKIFRLCADIATRLKDTNVPTAVIFLVCTLSIYAVKRFVNERYADRMKVPVPIELLVVILATIVSAQVRVDDVYSVTIVKEISVGLPRPRLPDVSVGLGYLSEGLIIIVVSFTQTVALGKIMGLKHNYRIDPNKEMFSLGIASVVCSFFSGFVPGASITCTVIQESAGGKTQIATLFSAALVLVVVMFLGPCFYYLPRCVLAAIVMVNIRSLFLKLLSIPALWRKSRMDCVVWVSTCLATVVLDTDLGLLVGMAVCMSGVLLRSMLAPVRRLGQVTVDKLQLWRSLDTYQDAEELPGVKVVGIRSDFYFANAELVTDHIVSLSGINPAKLKRKGVVLHVPLASKAASQQGSLHSRHNSETSVHEHPSRASSHCSSVEEDDDAKTAAEAENGPLIIRQDEGDPKGKGQGSSSEDHHHHHNHHHHHHSHHHNQQQQEHHHHQQQQEKQQEKQQEQQQEIFIEAPLSCLVIDFSCVSYMDLMAVGALEVLVRDYEAVGVRVCLTHLHERCVDTLRATGFLDKHCEKLFLTTAAALEHV